MKKSLSGEKQPDQSNAGWKVVQSIAMEMDAALAIAEGASCPWLTRYSLPSTGKFRNLEI
jgi:hypothetical protein